MEPSSHSHDEQIRYQLQQKAELMKHRHERSWSANFGLIASLGGVIIAPILLGLAGGSYLDDIFPQRFSWRLSCLFLGFLWGLINAFFWVKFEDRKIEQIDVLKKGENHE